MPTAPMSRGVLDVAFEVAETSEEDEAEAVSAVGLRE